MKTSKRILSFILSVMMLFSVASIAVVAENEASINLTDIDAGTDVGKAVTRLVSMGIINGYEDGTFRPDNNITRAEFCVVMVKFLSMQDYINPDAITGFEDLDTDENYAWARPYVAMAVQQGVINGFEDKTFRAADPVTYEQAVKMIICALGYGEKAQAPTIPGDWSSGYIAQAMRLKVTTGTTSYISKKSESSTRGTVALLVNNAVDANKADIRDDNGDLILDSSNTGDNLGYDEVKGIVTGTHLTEIEDADSSVPQNHIMIDDEYYEIGFSVDPNELIGCEVEAVVNTENENGDYPIIISINVTRKNNIVKIDPELVDDVDMEYILYRTSKDGKSKEAKLDENYRVIYNNKYYDYDLYEIKDIEAGSIILIDADNNKTYETIKVDKYDVFVVSSKSNSSQRITLMYGDKDGSSTITFPSSSSSLAFSLTRNGKDIKFTDIAKWDVLNIKESPEDADGKRVYEVVVTRETVSGNVTEIDSSDESYIVIGNEEYKIANSFLNYESEDKPELEVGEYAQVYLDAMGRIVAAAETRGTNSEEEYAYLYALRQNHDESEYALEFKFYTTKGKFIQVAAADKIEIDGVKYKAEDERVVDYLKESSDQANSSYTEGDSSGYYHQPIVYQTNSDGKVIAIHTTLSPDNESISTILGDKCYAGYDERTYKSKSFQDFMVNSTTKVIFIPDSRVTSENYLTFTSYSKAFTNNNKYHVEAYGLTGTSKTASLVLLYKENDTTKLTYQSPFMIVTNRSENKSGVVITGYVKGEPKKEQSIIVSEKCIDNPSVISKGDIVRYTVNSSNQITSFDLWFDASKADEKQIASYGDMGTIWDNRILALSSTGPVSQLNHATAPFRLQYGTVLQLILKDEGDETSDIEQTISISPTIVEDAIEMKTFGDEIFSQEIKNVNVFYFDRGSKNGSVEANADIRQIMAYEDYPEDATRVITYSTGSSLKMIYIIAD